jgi:leucyl/phenylalanyl-tRNA--protein transferase
MAEHRDEASVFWVEPRQRAILPLDGFHLSRTLRKTIASDRFRVTADAAFEQVIALCAQSVPDRPDTWINSAIEQVFVALHRRGFAHSVECWVSRARDASKVAIAALVARLRVGGFTLLDCQFMTDHLASLGAIEVPREDYLSLLSAALGEGSAGLSTGAALVSADFGALDRLGAASPSDTVSPPVSGKVIAQLLTQTS